MQTYIIYKPYGMLSQFTKEVETHVTLADLDFKFDSDVYPVGRLDSDSEGLLLLTNDKSLNQRLLSPKSKSPKVYHIQVEGTPSEAALQQIREGVTIRIKGKSIETQPCQINRVVDLPQFPDRVPPIRVRKSIPTTWLAITLTEGKNRQVRRMLATINHPVLRLIRTQFAGYQLGKSPLNQLKSGEIFTL